MERKRPTQSTYKRAVKAIYDPEAIKRIREILQGKPRDLLIFDLTTQTGGRMKDLLQLKVKDLIGLNIGDTLPIAGGKGNAPHATFMNETIHRTFQLYLRKIGPTEDDYLFKSKKGARPLNISSISNMVKGWFETANLKGLTGTNSLRKTWELHYKTNSEAQERNSMEILKPVQVATLRETVYKELFQAIVSGQIPPGIKLTVEKIAKQMKVGYMPVREALGKLEAAGLISSQKKRGSIVNKLSQENLREINTIRLALETMTAERACLSCTEETLNRLGAIHQQFIRAYKDNDVDEILRLNKEFHHLIYRHANMPILQQIIIGLWDRISPYLHILLREIEDLHKHESIIRSHQGMLDGMKHHDPEEVCKWLRADIIGSANLVIEKFDHERKGL